VTGASPEHDRLTDQDLLVATASGDPDAFAALYLRHRDWVVRLAWRFTRDEALALDVAQKVFIHLLRRAPNLTLTARLTTYLYPVTRHAALGAMRKKRPDLAGDGLLERPGPDLTTDDDLLGALAAGVADLPEPQREVLLMRTIHDMPLANIAEALQIPLGTVKSRLHAALSALRADPRTRDWLED
jgi:RNA polymerase sigma-70 factor (ECF subfamily)